MSEEIRNYNDLKLKLEKSITYYDRKIKLWQSVELQTKKDGTPYKVLNRNFKNAEIGAYYPVEDYAHPYLTASGYICPEGTPDAMQYQYYEKDHMPIYVGSYEAQRLPKHNPERETRSAYGCEIEIMTLDEIKAEIAHMIENYKKHKAEAARALAASEEVFSAVSEKVTEIKELIFSHGTGSPLYYGMADYLRAWGTWSR